MPGIESPGEAPGVNVSDSQGTQVGSGNTQYNAWMPKPSLDPAAMRDLNPHTAVAWLQELEHRELVNFFARASPDGVSEILEVFAEVDLTTVVAALGDISRRKATELIGAVDKDHFVALLGDLPEAAQAIARHAATLRWTDAGPLEAFTEGYARKHKNGHVFWSATFGMRTTVGAIDDCMTGDDVIPWGFPAGDQETAVPSPFGTEGIRQKFQEGMVYSSKHGVYRVAYESCYAVEGNSGGWLGFPRGEAKRSAGIARTQEFEGGLIYSTSAVGSEGFAVRREIISVLPGRVGWCPVSAKTTTVSSRDIQGTIQRVEFTLDEGTCETAVYSSEGYGAVAVVLEMWPYRTLWYVEANPKRHFSVDMGGSWMRVHFFEAGTIHPEPGISFLVSAEDKELLDQNRPLTGRIGVLTGQLGFPLTEEQPLGVNGADHIRFFKYGVVTCHDGEYRAWVSPYTASVSPYTFR